MNNTQTNAYLAGYLSKSAGVLGTGTDVAKWGMDKLLMLGLLGSAGIGAGAGALASKVTSPDVGDHKAIQNKLHSLELKEFRTELERRKKLADKQGINEANEEVSEGRSLRI